MLGRCAVLLRQLAGSAGVLLAEGADEVCDSRIECRGSFLVFFGCERALGLNNGRHAGKEHEQYSAPRDFPPLAPLRGTENHFTFMPGCAPLSGERMKRS